MIAQPPQSADRHRPYAPGANVIAVVRRVRARNLPERIDGDFLRVAGVSENVHGRVMDALRFLGLVGPDGRPTDALRAMSASPEQEYRELLSGVLHEAYREDFARIDPAQDSQAQIVDAFSPYQPRSQTSRMVILFLTLCREAGIAVSEQPRERAQQSAVRRSVVRPRAAGGATSVTSARVLRRPGSAQDVPVTGLAGVTQTDLLKLDKETFTKVWAALGEAFYEAGRASTPIREVDQSEADAEA